MQSPASDLPNDVAAPLVTDPAALALWRDRRNQFDVAAPEARIAALKATSTRIRREVLHAIDAAGLTVLDRADARPLHGRAMDPTDPLHAARAAERTSLWRLAAR